MALRYLAVGLVLLVVSTPLWSNPTVNEQGASSVIRTAPATRREPLPVQPGMPNAYRMNPVPKPVQA